MLYQNKKTGKFYVIEEEVINTTNDVDGQVMIVYRSEDIMEEQTFVREKTEFFEKFKPVPDMDSIFK